MPTFTTLKERNFGGQLTICAIDYKDCHVEHDRKEARRMKAVQEELDCQPNRPSGFIAYIHMEARGGF